MSVVSRIEVERETDERRLAEVVELAGVLACPRRAGGSASRRMDRQAPDWVAQGPVEARLA